MLDHRTFIRFAAFFEVAMAFLAVFFGWAAGVRPTNLAPDVRSWLVGFAATLPLIGFYYVATWLPFSPMQRIHTLLLATLGLPLSRCRWHELALLACLAGICEELLFRGVLQPWLGRLGEPAGWIGTNLLFGFAHAVTPTYFLLATGIGFYFSAVQSLAGGLIAPMIAHSLYDWFAFVQISRAYRRSLEIDDPADRS
ncbi:MAG: type II CAAX endopeptidase family protein [Planctomycetaceae bacterium]